MVQVSSSTVVSSQGSSISQEQAVLHVWASHQETDYFVVGKSNSRIKRSLALSFASHLMLAVLVSVLSRNFPEPIEAPLLPDLNNYSIVWIPEPGLGGGGGGGGNLSPEPPREVELPGEDDVSVPVVESPELEDLDTPEPEEVLEPELDIPAVAMASTEEAIAGVLDALPSFDVASQGLGTGGGAGTGDGVGIGPGQGSGLGPGEGGGTGGGAYRPGSGIELPRVLREVKPQYTADAMRAKVQGTVLLEAIVMPNGSVGQVKVIKSLDPIFGLDEEAVKAAKQWRFVPGTRLGQPVPVIITIELTFTLR